MHDKRQHHDGSTAPPRAVAAAHRADRHRRIVQQAHHLVAPANRAIDRRATQKGLGVAVTGRAEDLSERWRSEIQINPTVASSG